MFDSLYLYEDSGHLYNISRYWHILYTTKRKYILKLFNCHTKRRRLVLLKVSYFIWFTLDKSGMNTRFYLLRPLECVIITRHIGHDRAFVRFRSVYQIYIKHDRVKVFI